MAKVYQCDACGEVMGNPYKAKMREFFIGCSYELDHTFPSFDIRTTRIHLCETCYKGLRKLAENKEAT